MDNLVSRVLEFLTVPESSLSVVFLLIFIAIFGYGMYRIRMDKSAVTADMDNIVQEYKQVHGRYDAESFFKRKAEKLEINDAYIDDLPNLFVSIGILGTFIGLGIAIQGAAELLNDEKVDLHQLNAVLGIIAFKFQTSVWGTIFSIVFKEVFLEPYFVKRHNMITELREKLLGMETETTRTLLSKQLAGIDRMNVIFEEFNNIFHSKMDIFSSYVNRMNELLNKFNESVLAALNESKEDIINNQELMTAKQVALIDELRENIVDFHQKILEYSADTRDKFLAAQEEAAECQDRRLVEITRTIETLQKVFMRSEDEYIKRTQANLLIAMREHVQTIHKEYLKEAENIAAVMERIRAVSDRMGTDVENMHKEFIEEQHNTGNMLKNAYKKLSDTMVSVSSNSDKQLADISKISAVMENTAEVITDVKNKELSELLKIINTGIESINANVTSFNAGCLKISKAIETNTSSNERINEKLASAIKNNIKATSGVNLSVSDVKNSINETKSSVVRAVTAVENAVKDVHTGIGKIGSLYPSVMKESDKKIATIINDMMDQQIKENSHMKRAVEEALDEINKTNGEGFDKLFSVINELNDTVSQLSKNTVSEKNDVLSVKDSDKK